MSFEIAQGAPSAFTYDPQIGANETIGAGDTWIVQGGNAAIQTANGGADTLNINLILDAVTGGNLASINTNGLYVSPANAGAASITDVVDAASLLGLNAAGIPTRWNLTNQLIPFGTPTGGWGADAQLGFDPATGTLYSDILKTTTPPTSPGVPFLAYIEDATGEVGKFQIDPGNIILGLGTGGFTQFAPSCTPAVRSVAGLGMNPVTSEFDNVLFRERLAIRAVSANTTLTPSNDDVLFVDNSGGNVTVTLNAPAACDHNVFHIKQAVSGTTNQIILDPAGAATIDGVATHVFGNGNAAIRESRMIFWDGSQWHIL